ncbi:MULTISPECIES: alpha-L-rhamnosidase C-terminal domain-containing protein [Streptomyces]|uniref:Alpha-L-rhamnosidase C-terminal domain-containing protein n=1 Tax=Streptomyces dengpaensis TaxID=2049881 RepID=A0ABN5IC25_9ACTN|nr:MULTISPECIES: alpha-L-rhamnosidase C-terminal domain-containing protein [Streptomyces]AVH60685.1 hypothetical protein C4B68_38550 [Streptomyces dengpaensis]PIB03602.1 hypothetical protein B1C81_36445 [Streptomyces sp. HG99]
MSSVSGKAKKLSITAPSKQVPVRAADGRMPACLQRCPNNAGYRTITVRPDARTGVDWARTSIRTMRGRASVDWARSGDRLRLTVEVPVGAKAEVHVPAAQRHNTAAPHGAEFVRSEPGQVVYRVPHGTWEFAAMAESG